MVEVSSLMSGTDQGPGSAHVKSLWGESFRVVGGGLSEDDVVKFVEGLLIKQRVAEQRMAHIASLNELATKTVESAQRMAEEIKEEAEREARERSLAIISEAESNAQATVQDAQARANSIETEAARAMDRRFRELENTFASLVHWPEEELQAITNLSHRMESFRVVFEGLLGLLKNPLEPGADDGERVEE